MCALSFWALLSATISYPHHRVMVPPGLKLVQFTSVCGTSWCRKPTGGATCCSQWVHTMRQTKDIMEYKSCQLTWPSTVVWNDFSPTLLTLNGLPLPCLINANKRPDKALMKCSVCMCVWVCVCDCVIEYKVCHLILGLYYSQYLATQTPPLFHSPLKSCFPSRLLSYHPVDWTSKRGKSCWSILSNFHCCLVIFMYL